jgi:hypothetical protein
MRAYMTRHLRALICKHVRTIMFHHVRARSKNDDEDERPLNYGYKSTMAVLLPLPRSSQKRTQKKSSEERS